MARILASIAFTAALVGCADKPANPFEQSSPPVSIRREPLTAAAATLQLNDDCKSQGRAGCKSGVCFQSGPDQFHCSKECNTDADCGDARLECAQVTPDSEQGHYCVRVRAKSRPDRDGGAP